MSEFNTVVSEAQAYFNKYAHGDERTARPSDNAGFLTLDWCENRTFTLESATLHGDKCSIWGRCQCGHRYMIIMTRPVVTTGVGE